MIWLVRPKKSWYIEGFNFDLFFTIFSTDSIEDNEKCVDEEEDCESYKNFCDVYPKQMKKYCRKSCGFCTTGKYTLKWNSYQVLLGRDAFKESSLDNTLAAGPKPQPMII